MDIQTFIKRVGVTSASEILGVSLPAVKHYRNGIRKVAPIKVLSICEATGWQVTPHELRPDIYPNPSDGLPGDKRSGEAA